MGVTEDDLNVWLSINPDRPGTIVVMSRSTQQEIFRKGWTAT